MNILLRSYLLTLIIPLLILITWGCNRNTVSQQPNPTTENSSKENSTPSNPEKKCQLQPKNSNLPEFPQNLPAPQSPKWTQGSDYQNWGIGYLSMKSYSPGHLWLTNLILPLYNSPEGEFREWIACGWLVSDQIYPFTLGGLLQTDYEVLSFVVIEEDNKHKGWFRIHYHPPTKEHDGTAWIHRSHLNLTSQQLAITLWKDRFLPTEEEISLLENGNWGGYYFRNQNIPHALRQSASPDGKLITWIGADHTLQPIKIEGDWMYVWVSQPSHYCFSEPEKSTIHKGWVRWTSPQQGTWIYYYPRGC